MFDLFRRPKNITPFLNNHFIYGTMKACSRNLFILSMYLDRIKVGGSNHSETRDKLLAPFFFYNTVVLFVVVKRMTYD